MHMAATNAAPAEGRTHARATRFINMEHVHPATPTKKDTTIPTSRKSNKHQHRHGQYCYSPKHRHYIATYTELIACEIPSKSDSPRQPAGAVHARVATNVPLSRDQNLDCANANRGKLVTVDAVARAVLVTVDFPTAQSYPCSHALGTHVVAGYC